MNKLNELSSELNKNYIIFTGTLVKLRDNINQLLATNLGPSKDWNYTLEPLQQAMSLLENTTKDTTDIYKKLTSTLALYEQEKRRGQYVAELASRILNNEITATDVINIINQYYGSELFNPIAFKDISLKSILKAYDMNKTIEDNTWTNAFNNLLQLFNKSKENDT